MPVSQQAERVADALRGGTLVRDRVFDSLLPDELRKPSARFWSPVAVAVLAARWLAAGGGRRILDVGSGAGKFCTIGALVTRSSFVGIEHREHLVDRARRLAQRLGVADRVEFVHGGLGDVEPAEHDALYLFNPFEENALTRAEWLDDSIALSVGKYHDDVGAMEGAFERLGLGARVVTYEGFGGLLPDGFELVRSAVVHGGPLRLWRRIAAAC
jgi:SAM-dependent methyltransferase